MFKNVIALSAVLALTGSLMASPIYQDDFDDNNVSTNTNGVGSGLDDYSLSDDDESGGLITMSPTGNWHLWNAHMKSADHLDLLTSTGYVVSWRAGNYAVTNDIAGNDLQTQFGVVGSDYTDNRKGEWQIGGSGAVVITINKDENDGVPVMSGKITVNDATKSANSSATPVAMFTFDTWTGDTFIDIDLTISSAGFGVSLGEDYALDSGSLSHTWTDLKTDLGVDNTTGFDSSGEAHAFFSTSNVSNGQGSTQFDYLTIVVPEPATMALLGIGGLGALLRRRR